MEVMPATLLATNPFRDRTRLPRTTSGRTTGHVIWKKGVRLPASSKRRSVVNQDVSSSSSSSISSQDKPTHHASRRQPSGRVDVRPLGSVSGMQLMRLTRSADIELEKLRRDAGISCPPRTAPATMELVVEGDLQLPNIKGKKHSDVPSSVTDKKDDDGDDGDGGRKDADSIKGVKKSEGSFQRVGRHGYSRVDMVRNLQKHKKSLSASDGRRRTAAKGERRQHCAASKVESFSWGDSEVVIKGMGSGKSVSTTSSSTSDDELNSGQERGNNTKLPPTTEKWRTVDGERDVASARTCKSLICRLPQVESSPKEEADLSTSTLEDIILAKLEGNGSGGGGGGGDEVEEDRVRWEGLEMSSSPEAAASYTRPTSSGPDLEAPRPTARSDVATPELSDGALSNEETDVPGQLPTNRRRTLKHCSAVIRDMNGNLQNASSHSLGEDIAESVMRKLQPPNPHVIWPENRFMTSNTVFVYGSPSQLAPVIVPEHSVDCPLCNFFMPSAYGEICPPNSPTPLLQKDYGFYPVERFYSDF